MSRRDGVSCPLTGLTFKPDVTAMHGVVANLAHIIPNSVSDKVSVNFIHGFLDLISVISLTL